MKEGLLYCDIRTGELLECVTFNRSSYLFKNMNGALKDVPKTNDYKRVTSEIVKRAFRNKVMSHLAIK